MSSYTCKTENIYVNCTCKTKNFCQIVHVKLKISMSNCVCKTENFYTYKAENFCQIVHVKLKFFTCKNFYVNLYM